MLCFRKMVWSLKYLTCTVKHTFLLDAILGAIILYAIKDFPTCLRANLVGDKDLQAIARLNGSTFSFGTLLSPAGGGWGWKNKIFSTQK